MWAKFISLFLLNLLSFKLFTQTNLVVNPGFELSTACPTITGQYHLCNNWLNCNGNIGVGLWGTPDYYNTCGTFHPLYNPVPPNTALATCNPHMGNAMMGLVCYNTPYPNYREYVSNQLSCPMNPGDTYTVSFWINCGTLPKYKHNMSHFGVYLSATMPPQVGFNLINVTPQYEITTVINNTTWTQYSFTITPASTFNYITLGCYKADNVISTVNANPSAANPYAYWFIDDISIIGSSNFPVNVGINNASCNLSNGGATVTPISGSFTYTWLPGNTNTNTVANLAAGIYTVIMSNGCAIDTKTVNIGNSTSQTVSINSTTICSPSSVTLTANVTGGTLPYTYLWSNAGTSATNIVLANNTTVLTCTVTDNSGCVAVKSGSIIFNNVQSNFNHTFNSCKGKVFTTNTSIGATTYTWNFGDGFITNSVSPIHSYTSPGTYTITLFSSQAGNCIDSTKKIVVVNAISNSAFNYTTALCDSIVSFHNLSLGSATFLWNFGDGFNSSLQHPGTHTYNNPGIYTVTLISDAGGSCPDTVAKVISLNYNSIADFSVSVDPCNRSVQLTNLSSNSNVFLWSLGNLSTSTLTHLSYAYPNNSVHDYTIQLIVNNGSACADTAVKNIHLSNSVDADFKYTVDPCNGVVRLINMSNNAINYTWIFDKNEYSSEVNPTRRFPSGGFHQVQLIAHSAGACSDTANKFININISKVKADFEYINPNLTYDLEFTNTSSNALFYLWDFNDGVSTSIENPTHTFYDLRNARICLSAKNSLGCGDTICKDVRIKPDWTLYVPNTFSPDFNNINDSFFALATNITDFEISIFDRWGEEIFKADDITKSWDGTYKGKPVQDGVYTWKINFIDLYSKRHTLLGHVSVIK